MTVKGTNISGCMWLHQDKPNMNLACMTLTIAPASLIVVAILRPNAEAVLGSLLPAALVALAIFLMQAKTTNIEIDREKAAVMKTTNYSVFTTRKKYPLGEFNQVKLLTVDQPVQDGYRTIRYALVLSGKGRSLELLSADSEKEGQTIQRELVEFLGMTEKQPS